MVGVPRDSDRRATTLTLPIDLYDDLAALGLAEGRSMHREMIWLLTEGRDRRRALLEEGHRLLAERDARRDAAAA